MKKLNATKNYYPLRLVRICIGFLVLVSACHNRANEPVAIAPEDMCSYCKMAISEKRYAAEFIDVEGNVFKFDDIGCMMNFIKSQPPKNQIAVFYVMDYSDQQWIKADDAYFVRSTEFDTPMGGGIVAFKDAAKAEATANKNNGRQLRFDDLNK